MKNLLKLLLIVLTTGLLVQNSALAQLRAPTITNPANSAMLNAGTGGITYSWTKNNNNGYARYWLKVVETNGLNGTSISTVFEQDMGDVASATPSINYGAGKFYRFVVYARRTGFADAVSGARVFSINLQAPTIANPANNATFNTGTANIAYTWAKNNTNARYWLKVVETNGLNGNSLTTVFEQDMGDVSSATPNITYGAGKFYRFVVYVRKAGFTDAVSGSRVFSINPPPNAPSNLVGSSSTTLGVRNTNLTWRDNSNNETGFEIERSTSSNSGFTRIATVNANTTSYSDLDIRLSATIIYYRVRAVANTAASAYSNVTEVQGNTTPPSVTSYSVNPKKGVVNADGFTWEVRVSNVTSATQVFLEFCTPDNTTCNANSIVSEQLTLVSSITNGAGIYRRENRTLRSMGLYKTRFRIVHNGVTYYNDNGSWVNNLQVETTPHWNMEFLTQVYYRNWTTACMPTSAAMIANYLFSRTFVNTGRTITVGTETNIPVWREGEVITTQTYKWNGQRLYAKGINTDNTYNGALATYLRDYPKNGIAQIISEGCTEGFGPARNERSFRNQCGGRGSVNTSTTGGSTFGSRDEMRAFLTRVGIRFVTADALSTNAETRRQWFLSSIEKGPIIVSRNAHIFVIIGKDADGNFICHDPYSNSASPAVADPEPPDHNGAALVTYTWAHLNSGLSYATLIPIATNAVAVDRHNEFSPYHLYCDTDLEHTQLVGSNGTTINVNYDGDGIHNFNDNAFTYLGAATGFRYNFSLYRNGSGYLQMNSVNGTATHSATYEMQVRRNGNYRVQVGYVGANTNSNAVAYRVEILNSNRTPAPYALVNTTVNQQNGTGFQWANLMTSSLNLNTGHIIRITVTNAGNATNNGRNINIDMVRALYSGGTVSNGRVETSEELASLNEQIFSDADLMLYPNPANGNEVYFTQPISFTLLSIQGQVLQTYEEAQSRLDISSLKNGLYLIKTNEGKTMKLLIEK